MTDAQLEPGQSFTLGPVSASADQIIDFARHYDPQPFHLSDEGARGTIFGTLAASGWHTAAMAMQLLLTAGERPLRHDGLVAVRDLRWRRPVYPDDALTLSATVIEGPSADYSTALLDMTLSNQHDVAVLTLQVTVRLVLAAD